MQIWNRYTIPKDLTATYIGRGTMWGNPFVVGEQYSQGEAAAEYRSRLARALAGKDPSATAKVIALTGVEHITCSCKPKVCHGDCYAEIWNIIRDKNVKVLEGIRLWVKENGYSHGPDTDGKDHINIYTKAKTELGRLLSNLSGLSVDIPGVGKFASMEGYWYFLSTGEKHPELMGMNGYDAKKFGKTLERYYHPDFKEKVKEALKLRCDQNPQLIKMLKESVLPFKHYYCFGDSDYTVVYPPFDWLVREFEYLRKLYKGEWNSTIIAGSRDITDMKILEQAIAESEYGITEVVCGKAKGVDTLGEIWGKERGIPVKYFPADWDGLGKRAGVIRNMQMGDYADSAVVVIKDNSKGSTQMKEYMQKLGKPVFIKEIYSEPVT